MNHSLQARQPVLDEVTHHLEQAHEALESLLSVLALDAQRQEEEGAPASVERQQAQSTLRQMREQIAAVLEAAGSIPASGIAETARSEGADLQMPLGSI